MDRESKVVSLETAIKLKELGFPQNTERSWSTGTYPEHSSDGGRFIASLCYQNESFKYQRSLADRFAAPDIGELIEQLDKHGNEMAIGYNDSGCFWHFRIGGKGTGNMLQGFGRVYDGNELDDDRLVEVLAKSWIEEKNIS